MPPISITKRARSDDQKHERREAILSAANDHLQTVGFEAFSMAGLAKGLGFSKGTLYLYFRTREEVFLALSDLKMTAWASAFKQALHPDMQASEYCDAAFATAQQDPELLPLLMRLNAVIEHNVSIEALVIAKRSMRNQFVQFAEATAKALNLTAEQSLDLLRALMPLLVGAAQTDQGPALQDEELPADIREFIDSFDARQTFTTNACRIIQGIRAGD